MKYALLIYPGESPTLESAEWGELSGDERKAILDAYRIVNQAPGVKTGHRLQPADTATTVRVQDGETLTTDGPFVAIKEALGGFVLFEAEDLDAAIALAARIPAVYMGGAVEIRPIVDDSVPPSSH